MDTMQVDGGVIRFKIKDAGEYPPVSSNKSFFSMVSQTAHISFLFFFSLNRQLLVIAIKTSPCPLIPGELRVQWEAQDASEITSTPIFFCWHWGCSDQYRSSAYGKLSLHPSILSRALNSLLLQARPSEVGMDDFVRLHNHLGKVWPPLCSKCVWNHLIDLLAGLSMPLKWFGSQLVRTATLQVNHVQKRWQVDWLKILFFYLIQQIILQIISDYACWQWPPSIPQQSTAFNPT